MRVLLVEDDPPLAGAVLQGFAEASIDAAWAADAAGARTRLALVEYDVVVLDVLIPGGSGFDLCAALRRSGVRTPVLMLTARDSVADRVHGLEQGADDYLTKPFDFAELLARVRALARRPPFLAPEQVRVADLEVDLRSRSVRRAGREIVLTAREFSLLEVFLRHPGDVLSRAEIAARVWDENHDPFTNVLDVLIGRLRRKIDDNFDRKLIQTMRGAGYRLAE
ncbi:MAG TPA: response regulator transcription factor [Gemmatimonadaceae bacterium]|nr:response regulator transcription factor [Gemmatimonadaceae bacterium]